MAAARCFDLENEKEYMHGLLVNKLHDAIDEDKTKKIRQLLLSVLKKNLDAADMITMLNDLTYKGIIKVGEYSYLKRLLTDVGLQVLVDTVEKSEKEIQCLMDNNVVAEDEDTVQEESQENGERSKRKRTLDTSCERCAELKLKLELQKTERDTRANEFVLQIANRALTEDVLKNPRKRKRIYSELLQFKAELVGPIKTGSILLTVRFYSLEDLRYFWSKYKDGAVTAALSDILLSDKILEISREHHVVFYIKCDISEDAYIKARRKLSNEDEVPGAMDAMARVSISDDTQGQEAMQEGSSHEQMVSEAKEKKTEASGANVVEETETRTLGSSEDKPSLRNVKRTRPLTMATTLGIPSEIPRNEKENYFCMQLLLKRATEVLRDVLRTQLQAAYPGLFDPNKNDKLFDVLDNQQVKHSLLLLKKRKVMTSSQMELLYPSGTPSTTVTLQDLDLTLLVVLLRNITKLNPRAKWENPPASDISTEANIGRVKTYHNKHMHGGPAITDTAFQAEFNDLKHVLLSLSPIYTSDDYDKLLIEPLDAKVAPCQLLSVQLPGKLADIKGREDLVQQIQQHIAGETRLVLLTGMGGIGKTSVAIEVGHREPNVLYFDMSQITNLESVKLSLVQHYHPTLSLKDLYGDYQIILKQTLSSLTSNTVIIFDNNDEVIKSNLLEFHSLIQDILNSTKHVTLMCTSRDAFSLLSHNMAVLDVPPLDSASSIDILWEGKHTSLTGSESIALGEIADKCGRNPLALKLYVVQLKKKSAQRLLERMKNKNVMESLKVANLPASQEMMACLDMSYETLNTEEQKVFRALHIFPVSFSLEEVSEMLEIDEDECESLLDSLSNKSLLTADHSLYDLHPLLRAYAEYQARKDQNEISRIQDAYCKYYLKPIPLLVFEFDTLSSKETYEKAKKILPHLKVIASLLSDQLVNKELHDKEIAFIKFKNLYLIACVFLNVFLNPEALTILTTLELLDKKDFPSEQIGGSIYSAIANVLQKMGNYKEALTYLEKSLDIDKTMFGEKHPVTAMAYNNMGVTLSSMGKCAEGLIYYQKSLKIQKKILGEKHPDTAATYQNIGSTLSGMGKYKEALPYYEKYLGIDKEILSEKHPDTATTYQNIGSTLRDMGKYKEALPFFVKSLEIQKEILGEKHPDTALTHQNIGSILCDMGKYTEALPHYKESFEIQKEILGEKHPDTARASLYIGSALCGMGKYAEGLTYYEKALVIQNEILSQKNPSTATTLQIIGNALRDMGNYREALTYYEKSLEMQKELLGERHPDTALTYQNIGNALRDMGRYAKALACYEKSFEIQKEILGEKHPYTASTYQNIGTALCDMGMYAEALTYYEKSLETQKEILGEKHPSIARASIYIGTALCGMGRYAEALTYYEKALVIQKETLAEKHPSTATTLQNIGNALCCMGKYAKALTYYEKSLEIQKEILGEKHPDTGGVYHNVGNALCDMGNYAEALTYYEKSLEIQKEFLGERHPDTRVVFVEYFGTMHFKTKSLDILVCGVKQRILKMVINNMSKYIATELIVKGKYGQAVRFLSFIGWDFRLFYKF